MLSLIQIQGPDGINIPAWEAVFQINQNQQAIAVGIDFRILQGGVLEIDTAPGWECEPIGKLSDQSFILNAQLTNSLRLVEWPFEVCDDPEILLITKI